MSLREAVDAAVAGREVPGPVLESAFGEIMAGKSSRRTMNGPRRLVARPSSKVSREVCAIEAIWKTPAVLTTMSGAEPRSSVSRASAALTDDGFRRSISSASPPMSSAISRRASIERAATWTLAPAADSERAVASPMPRLAPTTNAEAPLKLTRLSRSLASPSFTAREGCDRPCTGGGIRRGSSDRRERTLAWPM